MRNLLLAAFAAASLGVMAAFTQVQAQQAQPPRGATAAPGYPNGIAVIDVTYILDNYARLKAQIEVFRRDVENTGKQLKGEQDNLVKGAEQLKQLKVGTPQYKDLEEKLAKQQSDLKVSMAIKEKEFADRESKQYLAAYQEIVAAVKAYAELNNITLVLRFNGAPADQNNRDAVRAEMFKTVMYYNRNIDITDQVLAALNRSAAVASPPKGGAGPAQPRR